MKEGMVFTPVSQGPAPADVWGKLTPVPADMGGVPLIQQSVAEHRPEEPHLAKLPLPVTLARASWQARRAGWDSDCPGVWVRWPSRGWHSRRGHFTAVPLDALLAGGLRGKPVGPLRMCHG